MSPARTGAQPLTAEPLTAEELTEIEARLPVGGLFAAHAHTDVTRLVAEVHRLRALAHGDRQADGGDRP